MVIFNIDHFAGACWNWKVFRDAEVTGVWNLLKGLVFGVVPGFEEITLASSACVSGGKKFLELVLYVLFQLGAEFILIKLKEFR